MTTTRPGRPWPSALAAGCAALATAWATDEWWLLPIGAAAGAALCLVSSSAPPLLPRGLDLQHRAQGQRLLAAQAAVLRELRLAPAGLRALLQGSERRVAELVALALCRLAQHQELGRHLEGSGEGEALREGERLRTRGRLEADPAARERFAQAAAAREATRGHRAELRRGLARLEGELAAVEVGLESVVAQLVKVRSAEARLAPGGASGQLAQALETLAAEIGAVAESIEHEFQPKENDR